MQPKIKQLKKKDAQHGRSLGNCKLKQQWNTNAHISQWLKSKTLTIPNAGEYVVPWELVHFQWECKMEQPILENSLAVFIKLILLLAYDPAMISFSIYLSESRSVVSDCLRPHGLYSSWNSPDQNTGIGSFSLLQGIFPTQESNQGLPHCRRILHQLNHKGSPRILEWVAYPFSRRSSQPRNWTRVSCIAGGFLTNWTIRKAVFT